MGYITYEVRVYPSGDRAWYFEGKLHRTDGPAIECASGYRAWYSDDKWHRTDGPAVEHADGGLEWWVDGVEMTEAEHAAKVAGCAGKIVEIDGRKYRLQEM